MRDYCIGGEGWGYDYAEILTVAVAFVSFSVFVGAEACCDVGFVVEWASIVVVSESAVESYWCPELVCCEWSVVCCVC